MYKRNILRTSLALAVASLAISATAQEAFEVAVGDPKGTYSAVFKELQAFCPIVGQGKPTNGSIDNLALLTGNDVTMALVQADLLFYTQQNDPSKVANIKTLFTLHPEELHFIARGEGKKEGGVTLGSFNVGGTAKQYKTLEDLAGRPVGAVGGSVLSGRVVSSVSGLNFKVVQYQKNEDLQKALLGGEVDAILVVGGAPHSLVKTLTPAYRILSVSPEQQKKLGSIYAPATLSYSNLGQTGVPTLTTQAIMVTRMFRSPEILGNLSKVRACFEQKLPTIQDTRKTHEKWQVIDASNKGKWTWYDLPAAK